MVLGIMAIAGGTLLLWSGFTGGHPWSPVVVAFGGEPLDPIGGAAVATSSTTQAAGAALGSYVAGKSGALTSRQVAALAREAGFHGAQVPAMVAIAFRESRWIPTAVNHEGGATGLWQIYPGGPQYLDPVTNAHAARSKFLASQAAGYSGYRPWASSRPSGSKF